MRKNTLQETELIERIQWLIRLRWIAIIGVLGAIVFSTQVLRLQLPLFSLLAVVAALTIYNLCVFTLAHRRLVPGTDGRELAYLLANLQISADLIALVLLIHFSGGIENPFAFYFIFHMIIAGILLSAVASYVQAALATGLFSAMVLLESQGLIHHVSLGIVPANLYNEYPVFLGSTLLVFGSTLFLAVYMATSIAGRLRARELEVLALTEQIEEKANQLQLAYDRLDEIERAKSTYMRKVSHELRSPLAAIQSSLRVVLDGLTGGVEGKTQEMIQRAERRSLGLLKLINDLLILSRAREMKEPAKFEPIRIQEVAGKAADLQHARAESKKISLITDIPTDLAPIAGNPEEIEQLLTNLIANAIKYTPEGGQVRVEASEQAEGISLSVTDTGIGISPEDLEKVFNEFYRSESARKFAEEGTGLGLSIVKSIVVSHDGRISVASEVGKGTRFEVLLPRHQDALRD